MLTVAAVNKYKEFTKKMVSHGRYKIGSTFYDVPIHNVAIDGTNVHVYLLIDHGAVGTVTQSQLFDIDGELFADKPDSITKDGTQGVLVRFSFSIQEV